jgi:hypothetical protein
MIFILFQSPFFAALCLPDTRFNHPPDSVGRTPGGIRGTNFNLPSKLIGLVIYFLGIF